MHSAWQVTSPKAQELRQSWVGLRDTEGAAEVLVSVVLAAMAAVAKPRAMRIVENFILVIR